MRLHRPRHATVVAYLALFTALSGTAVATAAALQSGDSVIAQRTLSGNRLKHNTVTGYEIAESSLGTVPRAKSLPPLVWHDLTLINGWTNYWGTAHAPAYAVDAQGLVHLRGFVDHLAGSPVGNAIAALPPTLAPSHPILLPTEVSTADGPSTAILRVAPTTGQLFVMDPNANGIGANGTELDGITYSPN